MYDYNSRLKVINFFGGPGVGKSTTAAFLFAKMKKKGYKVEFVHEVAKDLVWDKRHDMFTEQDYILGLQHRLVRRLVFHDIDYAVVDSSILLGLLYKPTWYPQSFTPFVLDLFKSYSNINIMLERNPEIPYVQAGRNESPEQAIDKDKQLKTIFHEHSIPYTSFCVQDNVEDKVLEYVLCWETGQHR